MIENVLNQYKELLWAENNKQNLISRQMKKEEVDDHIKDSKAILDFVKLDREKIIDIGSGAGFPGLVLGCYLPESSLTLVESDQKKSAFLARMTRELNLHHLEVINQRVEALGHNDFYRGQYDLCTNRAVAELRVVVEYGIPLLKVGGKLVAWKGINYREEIEQAQKALELLKTQVINIYEYDSSLDKKRALVVLQKKAATLDRFPRRTGIPAKRPL